MDDIIANGLHCHYKHCIFRFPIDQPELATAHYQEDHGYASDYAPDATKCQSCKIRYNTVKELRSGFETDLKNSSLIP